jgi:DNA replication protein DnaC
MMKILSTLVILCLPFAAQSSTQNNPDIFKIESESILPPLALTELKKNYSGLSIEVYQESSYTRTQYTFRAKDVVLPESVTEEVNIVQSIKNDIHFYLQNPTLPVENICSNFWNYYPQNKSQQEMLDVAKRLVAYDGKKSAGLYLHGKSGLGKTHIAVAVAKACMQNGSRATFVRPKMVLDACASPVIVSDPDYFVPKLVYKEDVQNKYTEVSYLKNYDVFILDKLYHRTNLYSCLLFNAVTDYALENRAIKLVITSNQDGDSQLRQFVDPAEFDSVADRLNSVYCEQLVEGDSYRHRGASLWWIQEDNAQSTDSKDSDQDSSMNK